MLPSHADAGQLVFDCFTNTETSTSPESRAAKSRSATSIWDFLDGENTGWSTSSYNRNRSVYVQGEPANAVFFLLEGWVKISTVSSQGKLAVVGLVTVNDVIGEYCARGDHFHTSTATAMERTKVIRLEASHLRQMLQHNPGFAEYFVQVLLRRNRVLEGGLVNQLFNSSERRLANIFLELGSRNNGILPRFSQETLAGMVGTTRSRISFFMKRMKRAGLLREDGGMTVSVNQLAQYLEQE
jgi:CRP/FNR family cyclic AMP-dependent transcriptional regulator